ncbi:helix-turn-helix domain-containing protein [Hymenobacter rubripertinctus]|uniref:DNA-binding protein n=1 Tax=Hymenobacter rubripertinctus TaxID=2029981 RepID=A0A418R8Y5_9BACT|nr:helix-turn-helix domain-containing protein [Hymenobacter rubripertinctus]RIY13754.1 DNA-binding protein [Hymenobacter rubripertinctus]
MQAAYIVPATEWDNLTARLARLESAEAARQAPAPPPDDVLTTAQAAAYIGLSVDALLRARKDGRLPGVRLNDRDWGFRRSSLDKYPRRYARVTNPAS